MADKDPENLTFEEALAALEELVENMERGELSLEESLRSFEHGVMLTRTCQDALKTAEQKVEILTANDPNSTPDEFKSDN